MQYFKRMFNCGSNEDDDRNVTSFPGICLMKTKKPLQDMLIPTKTINKSIKTFSSGSSYNNSPVKKEPAKTLPPLRILSCVDMRGTGLVEMDMGFLVGVIDSGRTYKSVVDSECFKVKIGKGHEINSLSSLRHNCLDCVMIFWSHLGCQFSISELLTLDQRLVVVFQQWESLTPFLKNVEGEMSYVFEGLPLKRISNRLLSNLIQKQKFTFLQFLSGSQAQKVIKDNIEKVINETIEEKHFESLLNILTLQDYKRMKNNEKKEKKRIIEHLEVLRAESIAIQLLISQQNYGTVVIASEVNQDKNDDFSEVKVSSADMNPDELKFYMKRLSNESNSPQFNVQIEADLNIFNYNFQQFQSPFEDSSLRKQNLASPSKSSRKLRTRSEHITPSESYTFEDDQMYDKYQ